MGFHSYTAPRIAQWSYSRYATYKECPLKARLKFIQRLDEPSNKYLEHGVAMHKLVENYLNGGDADPALEALLSTLAAARDLGARPEVELAFTSDWRQVGWFDPTVQVRVKADVLIGPFDDGRLVLVDVKTGKQRDYTAQLELYALAALKAWPEVTRVEAAIWYLDGNVVAFPEQTRADEQRLQDLWAERTRPLLNDDIFAPLPGSYCRYCHFRRANGGPCSAS